MLKPNLFSSIKNLMLSVGVSAEESWKSERAKDFLFEKIIESNKFTNLSIDVVREAASAWGGAFGCRLSSNGVRGFEAVGGLPLDESAFREFKDDLLTVAPTHPVNISISFDKAMFAGTIFQEAADLHFAMYVFASSFERAYSGTFSEIEKMFFPEPKTRCVCLVLEKEVSLLGPSLAIVGPASFERGHLETHQPIAVGRQDRAREIRNDNVSWINFDTRLTPYHLLLMAPAGSPEDFTNLAARKLFDLTLIYIADSVRHEKGGYEATFSGVPVARVFAPLSGAITPSNTPVFFRLFHWAYLRGGTDKLAVLRAAIPSVLTGDRARNYEALDKSARRISESTRASYGSLVRGVVRRHFDNLKEVDKYVQETGFQLGDQISGLAANLTTNMLGTVGVMVGAFISYVIDKKATPKLLAVGTILYGGYVLFFPLLYSLLLQNLVQYVITVREFRERIQQFAVSLTWPELTNRYEPMIRSRRLHFWAIFCISCFVYIVLIAGSFFSYRYFRLLPSTP